MTPGVLQHLFESTSEVYLPLLTNSNNQQGLPEVVIKDVMEYCTRLTSLFPSSWLFAYDSMRQLLHNVMQHVEPETFLWRLHLVRFQIAFTTLFFIAASRMPCCIVTDIASAVVA